MNDDSVKVWAKAQINFPELTTFTVCSWVKFTYEVRTYNNYILSILSFKNSMHHIFIENI